MKYEILENRFTAKDAKDAKDLKNEIEKLIKNFPILFSFASFAVKISLAFNN